MCVASTLEEVEDSLADMRILKATVEQREPYGLGHISVNGNP